MGTDRRAALVAAGMLLAAAAATAGCAGAPVAAVAAVSAEPRVAIAREELDAGRELEPRVLEPVAQILTEAGRAPSPAEAPVAHAAGRGLIARISKKREWGTQADALRSDLVLAARCVALAPALLTATDLGLFVEEIHRLRRPADARAFVTTYLDLGLPRSAAGSAAILRGVSGRFPVEGVLEMLFQRGFDVDDDATLRSYAETIVADRFAVDDLLFVMRRLEAPAAVAAKLPVFADRLMAWVVARPPGDPNPEARRRIFHNAAVALVQAQERGVPLPPATYYGWIRPSAERADVSVDDLAAAYAAYGKPIAGLLDARLSAIRGARATGDALVELLQVASLMAEINHPRAPDALELAQRAIERPLGIDERIGRAGRGRGYSEAAVRRIAEQVAGPLRAAIRARLYLDTLASLLYEQGEVELAQTCAPRNLASRR